MGDRFDRKVDEAKALEGRLIEAGQHADAQVVSRLRRAALSARGTLKVVHRDYQELRREYGLPCFADDHQ